MDEFSGAEELSLFKDEDEEELLDDAAGPTTQPDIEIPTERPMPGLVDIGEFEFSISRIVGVKPDRNGFFNIRFAARCLRGRPAGNEGRELIDGLSLSPDAAFRRYQFLDAIGAPSDRPLRKSELVDKRFWASTRHDFYNNVASAKIATFLLGPSSGGKAPPAVPETGEAHAGPPAPNAPPTPRPRFLPPSGDDGPATLTQVAAVNKLLAANGRPPAAEGLTRKAASKLITDLLPQR